MTTYNRNKFKSKESYLRNLANTVGFLPYDITAVHSNITFSSALSLFDSSPTGIQIFLNFSLFASPGAEKPNKPNQFTRSV